MNHGAYELKNAMTNIVVLIIILLLYFLGLAIFLRENVGGGAMNFQDNFYIINLLLEMNSGIKKFWISLFEEDYYYPLNIFVIYVPYMILCFFVITNIFVGIMNWTYRKYKHSEDEEIDGMLTLKEFYNMTVEALKRHPYKNHSTLDITDDVVFQKKEDLIFDDFHDLYEARFNLKDTRSWSTMCAQVMQKEYLVRRDFKNLAKQITALKENEEILKLRGIKIHEKHDVKVREFKLRLKYWSYFRAGNYSLMKLMALYSKNNEKLDKELSDIKNLIEKKNADQKIKRYILYLEKKVEENMNQINLMQNKMSFATHTENLYRSVASHPDQYNYPYNVN